MKDKKVLSRDPRRYTLPSERALGAETHSYMPELCDQLQTGRISRRDSGPRATDGRLWVRLGD